MHFVASTPYPQRCLVRGRKGTCARTGFALGRDFLRDADSPDADGRPGASGGASELVEELAPRDE